LRQQDLSQCLAEPVVIVHTEPPQARDQIGRQRDIPQRFVEPR
jgi:hypothetical protein